MKRIAIFHYKVGDTDGVSLEIEKWRIALEVLGHEVFLCAGDLGGAEGTCIAEMYHHSPEAERLYANTFIVLQGTEAAYRAELEQVAGTIEEQLFRFVEEKQIDVLVPHNLWSVAMNPAVALAIARVARELNLPVLAQHHDFYWERIGGVSLTCATAVEMADKYLPPRYPSIRHAVINSLAQRELRERKGIESTVIPNVFDFTAPDWTVDEFNQDFRDRIGLRENDICILQATRIVPRKGIELAIDFVAALGSPQRRQILEQRGLFDGRPFTSADRIVLVLAGYAQDDPGGQYLGKLKAKIAATGIDALFIEEVIGENRQQTNGEKVYSLWDTYVFADFVTYPSLWEGWGNQLLEALRGRLPFLLFEYPVYVADIKDKGFRAVTLGSEVLGRDERGLVQVSRDVIEAAADESIELLTNKSLRQKIGDHNFRIAQEYYSLAILCGLFEEIIGKSP